MDGFKVLDILKENKLALNTKILFISAFGDIQTGMKAIERGCFDFIAKPFNMDNLLFKISQILGYINTDNKFLKFKIEVFNSLILISVSFL